MQKKRFTHPEYGNIEITMNRRARQIIMRAQQDAIHITIPPIATANDIERALAKHGKQLLTELKKNKKKIIKQGTALNAPNFSLKLSATNSNKFILIKDTEGKYLLQCPETADISKSNIQTWIEKAIISALQHRAKEILPARLSVLASKHNFNYKRVTTRNSRTQWGSCSNNGTISLSIYLILLPDTLIDYVLLHELCHTIEMNHSPRFWALLDKACACNSKELRAKLKEYKTELYAFITDDAKTS